MKYLYLISSILLVLLEVFYFIMSYMVNKIDVDTGIIFDGFGRKLTEPPKVIQFIIEQPLWKGWIWQTAEGIVLFGGVYLALYLFSKYSDSIYSEGVV